MSKRFYDSLLEILTIETDHAMAVNWHLERERIEIEYAQDLITKAEYENVIGFLKEMCQSTTQAWQNHSKIQQNLRKKPSFNWFIILQLIGFVILILSFAKDAKSSLFLLPANAMYVWGALLVIFSIDTKTNFGFNVQYTSGTVIQLLSLIFFNEAFHNLFLIVGIIIFSISFLLLTIVKKIQNERP